MSERLTDEQLRDVRGWSGPEWRGALDEILALRARVAQLEAALREARGWVVNFDNAEPYRHHATLGRIDAALKDAPQ